MNSFRYKKRKKAAILFTCEHASGRIPREYGQLGLTRKELQSSKDWYDIGALDVMHILAYKHVASFIHTTFSRLVIDANRNTHGPNGSRDAFHAPALKTEVMIEDALGERTVQIPRNQVKNYKYEQKKRWEKLVRPYQQQAEALIDWLIAAHGTVYVVQVHSFFPTYHGYNRVTDIDVMSYNNGTSVHSVFEHLYASTDLHISHNKPWGMEDVDGVFDHLKNNSNIEFIGFDINNKHLRSKKDIRHIGMLISDALQETITS